jgi:hypothetical protein
MNRIACVVNGLLRDSQPCSAAIGGCCDGASNLGHSTAAMQGSRWGQRLLHTGTTDEGLRCLEGPTAGKGGAQRTP